MSSMPCLRRVPAPIALSLVALVAGSLTQAVAAAGTLVAIGCAGNEVVLVQNNFDPPVLQNATVPGGPAQFAPTAFDACVSAMSDTIKACADVNASWLDLGGGNVASGFVMAGQLSVNKLLPGDKASAQQTRTLIVTIAGATVSEPYFLELAGTRSGTLTVAQAPLECTVVNQNGILVYAGTASGFATTLSLTNGTYTISLKASAELTTASGGGGGVLDFELALRTPTIDCGSPLAGSCFLAHASPHCSDQSCCETVCTIDAYCCELAWDQTCVEQATLGCQPTDAITDGVIDPLSGKRYALYDDAIWLVARDTIEADGGQLAVVRSLDHQRWIRDTLLAVPPLFGTGSAWIGFTDAQHENAIEGNFLWESGAPVTFTNWAPGQPNAAAPDDDYVSMRSSDGRWHDELGFDRRPAIAEFSTPGCGSGGSCFTAHAPGCNDATCCEAVCATDDYCCTTSWDATCVGLAQSLCVDTIVAGPFIHHPTRHRYYITSSSHASIAERRARLLGGTLAVPDTAAENTWLRLNLANGSVGAINGWLGIHDQLVEGQWQTQRGLLSGFTAWDFQQPDNNGNADLVQMKPTPAVPGFGSWSDVQTGAIGYGFIEIACEGDLSDDGSIGAADLSILLGAWGGPEGDLNADGTTNAADLSVLLGLWGPCATTSCCTPHGPGGCDLPVCQACVCEIDPSCCSTEWDAGCVTIGATACRDQCQCDF